MKGLLIAVGVLLMVGCEKPPVYKSHHVHVVCPKGDGAIEKTVSDPDTAPWWTDVPGAYNPALCARNPEPVIPVIPVIPAYDSLADYYDATTGRTELMGWAVPIEDLPLDDAQVELVWKRDGKEHRAFFNVMTKPTRFVDEEHTTMLTLNSKRKH